MYIVPLPYDPKQTFHDATGITALLQNLTRFQFRFKWYVFALVFELILFLVIVLFADQSGSVPLLPGVKVWLVNLRDFIINTSEDQ